MPLAFTHEDFLVLSNKNRLMFHITKKKKCSENREISKNCVTVIRKCQWLSFIKYNVRGLLVAVGRCNTQVWLSLTYVPGKPPRPPVPRIPLRKVLRSVTHKQDAHIVNKVYC